MSVLNKLLGKKTRAQRAVDEYNLGLKAKYAGDWKASLKHNQAAAELRGDDEATWWNLAIAATALKDWAEARRGWAACGINMKDGEGEISARCGRACVRLAPEGAAEVVWGDRIDPARIVVKNVPLPESDRLYGDIILNDGAQEGTRTSDGEEYPVFNELAVWRRSSYSTYLIEVSGATEEAGEGLRRICDESDVWAEDWGTMRMLCMECSLGDPGEHACGHAEEAGAASRFGIAAKSESEVVEVLARWREVESGIRVGQIVLAVSGVRQ